MSADPPVQIVLASKSPQRRALLAELVAQFEVIDPLVDESGFLGRTPETVASELARAKAQEVARRRPDALVIGADTVVECCGELLGKPSDRADAVRMLTMLSRHPHRVISAVCVVTPDGRLRQAVSIAALRMRPLGAEEIGAYVDREDVMNRAGAYGIQEHDPNVASLQGSRSAVMGLPLEELGDILESLCTENAGSG